MGNWEVINVSSKEEFDRYTLYNVARPAIVDFSAAWCGPCKMITPIFNELSLKYSRRVAFLKVDIDSNQDIASEYQIASVPTFVIFARGKKREQISGADPSALERLIEKYQYMQASFQGTGRKLTEGGPSRAEPPLQAGEAAAFVVDESKPTTSLQIRSSKGSRVVAKFNTSTTIAQLKSHIRSVFPEGPTRFSLMVGIPAPKSLTCDDSSTLEAAGLLDSVVIQRA